MDELAVDYRLALLLPFKIYGHIVTSTWQVQTIFVQVYVCCFQTYIYKRMQLDKSGEGCFI